MPPSPRSPTAILLVILLVGLTLMIGVAVARRGTPAATVAFQSTSYRIDLNAADAATLQLLPGIGAVVANHVVTYRDTHGKLQSIDDLQSVRMIGPTIRRRVEPYVTLDGQ